MGLTPEEQEAAARRSWSVNNDYPRPILSDAPSQAVKRAWREQARQAYRDAQVAREITQLAWWGFEGPSPGLPLVKAARARANSQIVADLLRDREPGLAAILDRVVRELS